MKSIKDHQNMNITSEELQTDTKIKNSKRNKRLKISYSLIIIIIVNNKLNFM